MTDEIKITQSTDTKVQSIIQSDLEKKTDQLVTTLMNAYGARGELTTDTIVLAVTRAMLAAKEMTMLDGATKKTVVLDALKQFVTKHTNLSEETRATLLVFIVTFAPSIIDNNVWQGQQGINYSAPPSRCIFSC